MTPMTIADDTQNPRPDRRLGKSLDAIAALRAAMEKRLVEEAAAQTVVAEETAKMLPPKAEVPPPRGKPQKDAGGKDLENKDAEKKGAYSSTASMGAKKGAAAPDFAPLGPEAAASAATERVGTIKTLPPTFDITEWPHIMFRLADRVQKIMREFVETAGKNPAEIPNYDPAHVSEAFAELTGRILDDPERFTEAQLALWQGYLRLWQSALQRLQGKEAQPVVVPATGDKRFQDQDWQKVWLFDFIKQTYLFTADWVHNLVQKETDRLDSHLAQKLHFYTKQAIDAIAPSNFWMTNPEVLRETMATGGENLVKGLENLLADLEAGHGMLRIRMTDETAFKVGGNLANTQGRVVYENALMQLIQYAPQTESVFATPMLIIPPWINKFYILDLREKNSFIRHLVNEGHTVFCISWVNPKARHALMNFDDYVSSGIFEAMRQIRTLTGAGDVNMLGYCIGGTALASALAYLKAVEPKPTDLPQVKSATYLVTMVDFSEPGDLGVFIDEDQVAAMEARMARKGYLDATVMATTFNLLRSNDLIWSFVINNYLLGREPFPFDILYWNSDSTNLPAVMHSYYLRKMYMANKLVEPNGLQMKGVPIDLRQIDVPSFVLATEDDHIAPWRSTYEATQIYRGPVRFVLAGSGHIAGIINPPANNKYGYWTNDNCVKDADAWRGAATEHKGSWWTEWYGWLKNHAGQKVAARAVPEGIEAAPGRYVLVKA